MSNEPRDPHRLDSIVTLTLSSARSEAPLFGMIDWSRARPLRPPWLRKAIRSML